MSRQLIGIGFIAAVFSMVSCKPVFEEYTRSDGFVRKHLVFYRDGSFKFESIG